MYACKLIDRKQVKEVLKRELKNHRNISPHPNVIGFKEVGLDDYSQRLLNDAAYLVDKNYTTILYLISKQRFSRHLL